MNGKLYTHELWVVNRLAKDALPYLRVIQSVYPCPSHAADAFVERNHNVFKVVGYKGIKLDDAPLEPNPPKTLAECVVGAPAVPEAVEVEFTKLLEDTVAFNVDGEAKSLNVFAEYDHGRCEVTIVYSSGSTTEYALTLVANTLQSATSMCRVLVMQGNLTHALRRLATLEQLRRGCENKNGGQ